MFLPDVAKGTPAGYENVDGVWRCAALGEEGDSGGGGFSDLVRLVQLHGLDAVVLWLTQVSASQALT